MKTVGSTHATQFLVPALLVSGLFNLVAGTHFMSSFFDSGVAPEATERRREDWTEQLIEANFPYSVEPMQTAGGDVERPPEEVEEEQAVVEMEEQRFEDIYTPEVYYDLPRALPMQYYAIA